MPEGTSMTWDKLTGRGVPAQPRGTGSATETPAPASSVADPDATEVRRDLRRSKRVYIAMAVRISANRGKDSFQEETATETVNAHGCMVRLAAAVQRGEKVVLTNGLTGESVECSVASIGRPDNGKRQVGFEFEKPAGYFWHIAFPPEDWSLLERKRPEQARPTLTAPKRTSP